MPNAPAVNVAQFLRSFEAQALSAAQIECIAAFHAEHGPATVARYLEVAAAAPSNPTLPPVLTAEEERAMGDAPNDLLSTTR